MITANLATYPPRREALEKVVAAISPQVDRLNVVLNEYDAAPAELKKYPNVVPLIPETDLKDAGKFYPDVRDATYVLLIDDDILYPPDFVSSTVSSFASLTLQPSMGGYHGSLYRKPTLRQFLRSPKLLFTYKKRTADLRDRDFHFCSELKLATVVDQIATNAAILRGQDMPPFEFMRDSMKFVDVRLARWCFERGIAPVCLPRATNWLRAISFDESIFESFTKKNPPHVNAEIQTFAYKVKHRGQSVNKV